MNGELNFNGEKIQLKTSADLVKFSDTTLDNQLKTFHVKSAKTSYLQQKIREICGDVDSGMTLARLVESLNKNPNFAADISKAIAAKQNKNSTLDKIAALNLSANNIILSTDSETLTTSSISELGRKILSAENLSNFAGIIGSNVNQEFCWDETERIHWQKVGSPTLTTTNSKFGGKALQCSASNYVQSKESITFGGADFTLDFWLYLSSSSANYSNFFSAGSDFYLQKTSSAINTHVNGVNYVSLGSLNSLIHVELCYNYSSKTLYGFSNGVGKSITSGKTISRSARQITLGGGAICSIAGFRLLDGVCLHTANFSPPTEIYQLTNETKSLLTFQ